MFKKNLQKVFVLVMLMTLPLQSLLTIINSNINNYVQPVSASQSSEIYGYDKPDDTNNFVYYSGSYDQATYPRKALNAAFTTDEITVDGTLDEAYSAAMQSNIANTKVLSAKTNAANQSSANPTGVLRTIWTGPTLYLFVEVTDPTYVTNTTAPANGGAMTSKPAVPTNRDSVIFGFDTYNEKVHYETDTTGVFTVDSAGYLYYFRSSNIPSLGCVHGDPNHPEYTNRIQSYAATATATGYNVELALHIEGLGLENGTEFGIDVQISNVEQLNSGYGRTSNTFWSHDQNTLYAEYDHERPIAVDWGTVTLDGWNGTDAFAFSNWRITNALAYLSSIRFPTGVWRSESQTALDNAKLVAEETIAQGITDKETVLAVADELETAINGLLWADTRYPDPTVLEDQFTLPNPYKFFGSDGKSTRMVESLEDWEERRAEIIDLAQFYEYGYKPAAPDQTSIAIRWSSTSGCYVITSTITYGAVSKSLEFRLYMPTAAQLTASGHTDGNIPVVLSYGNISQFTAAGIAVLTIPAVASDTRTNAYAWGSRTGVFYDLFPYSRNGEGALKEVSVTMAQAWAASRGIDALELMDSFQELVSGVDVRTLVSPSDLGITGFSYQGKYAFVAAVFDDRIDVCIPGAAGATGPSPWRYVYAGQSYDWSDTDWAPNGAAQQVAFGTEFMANSVRHNRVRETETFRRFLTPGNFYAKLDGAYGYGTRLPFDQNDLVATLAGRAIILNNTINDYNDGSVADGLSLDLAKSVYSNLGYDADSLIKYNYRTVQPTGDPHGSDAAQRVREAEYMNEYFYGTEMSEATDTWLSTNPYNLNVSNNKTQSPYDYYYGGYNTITGGTGGINGNDGWYYYDKLALPEPSDVTLPSGTGYAAEFESGSESPVNFRGSFSFRVNLYDAYNQSVITVKTNGTVIAPDANGVYIVSNVTEVQTVTVEGLEINTYAVTLPSGTGYTAVFESGSQSPINHGDSYSFRINLDSAYNKSSITVQLNETVITPDTSGVYTVLNISEDQTVTVEGLELNKYFVTMPSSTGFTTTIENAVIHDGSYSFCVNLDDAYDQSVIIVKANGTVLTSDANGLYTISNITEDQTITVEGVQKKILNVTLPNDSGYTASVASGSQSTVNYGGSFSFRVTLDDTYNHSDITVKANGTVITAVGGFYTATNITNDLIITVEGVALNTYREGVLLNLTIDNGEIPVDFDKDVTEYTILVGNRVSSFTVLPEASIVGASVTVNGKQAVSGVEVDLSVGENIITVVVIAQDGITARTYTLTVTRAEMVNCSSTLYYNSMAILLSFAVIAFAIYLKKHVVIKSK